MKRLKTIVSLLAATALLFLVPGAKRLQVSAAEPTTYSLKYVEDKGEWRYQEGSWDNNNSWNRELYYLKESIKDGDILVIENGDHGLILDLPVTLSNITFNHAHSAAITVKGADNVYVLRDSKASVTGNVVNAHVYDNAIANFNDNVTSLFITKESSGSQTITVVGTVDYVRTADGEKVYNELYNFQANSFCQEEGILKTDPSKYSTIPAVVAPVLPADPSATVPVAPIAPVDPSATIPVAPVAPVDPSAVAPVVPVNPSAVAPVTPTDSLYDDVPKTGEPLALPGLLVIAAGFCFGGACLIKRKSA